MKNSSFLFFFFCFFCMGCSHLEENAQLKIEDEQGEVLISEVFSRAENCNCSIKAMNHTPFEVDICAEDSSNSNCSFTPCGGGGSTFTGKFFSNVGNPVTPGNSFSFSIEKNSNFRIVNRRSHPIHIKVTCNNSAGATYTLSGLGGSKNFYVNGSCAASLTSCF